MLADLVDQAHGAVLHSSLRLVRGHVATRNRDGTSTTFHKEVPTHRRRGDRGNGLGVNSQAYGVEGYPMKSKLDPDEAVAALAGGIV